MRTSALVDAKHFEFFEIYGVTARTRGVEAVQTLCGQGEVNLSRFCADVLHGWPLSVNHSPAGLILIQMFFFDFAESFIF